MDELCKIVLIALIRYAMSKINAIEDQWTSDIRYDELSYGQLSIAELIYLLEKDNRL